MNLYIIGMPGCGKSTISRDLASKLGLKRVDLDEEIVKAEGRSIESIFAESGEAYFRQSEKKHLEKLSAEKGLIVATGGGAPCFFDNIGLMNKTGVTVFLDVPASALTERLVAPAKDVRPMVKGKTKEEVLTFVRGKLEERLPFYSRATISVEGSNIKAREIISRLEALNITFSQA